MSNKDEIYVLTPPYYKTGGTELCHQLVYTINSLGGRAYVLYLVANDGKYLNPSFEKYVSIYKIISSEIYDNFEGIVVIPEIETLQIPRFKKAKIYLWWMSVDNYYRWQNLKYIYEEKGFLRTIKFLITNYSIKKKYLPIKKMGCVTLHLAQSEYAVNFLERNRIKNIAFLSDFINEEYLPTGETGKLERQDIVLYNPNKGLLFTKEIIKRNPNVRFVALAGMCNSEIKEWMHKAKVYIDFGAHPGKDRMPREAALSGCCIITGRRGAANFNDVYIPNKYKIKDKKENIPLISKTIIDIFNHYDERIVELDAYRQKIIGEKAEFQKAVEDIFI